MFFSIDKNGVCRMVADKNKLNLPGLDLNILDSLGTTQIITTKDNVFIVGRFIDSEQFQSSSDFIQSHWREFLA